MEQTNGTVVARVNGVGITQQSLISVMDRLKKQNGSKTDSPAEKEGRRKTALDRLIIEELAWQKARTEGLKADQAEVDKKLEGFKAKLGDEAFRKTLESRQITEEELRMQIEKFIVFQLIFKKEVADVSAKTSFSEYDLRREYEKEKVRFVMPEKVEVTDIVFFLETEDPRSMKIAEGVLSEILARKDRDPHGLTSDGTYVVYDTELKKEEQPELYQEAKKLKEGELSGVIKTADSLHIIKMMTYRPEKRVPLDEARGYLEKKLKADAFGRRLREWEAELRAKAKIEIMGEQEGKTKEQQGSN